MRTVTFQSVLYGVAYLLGLDPRQNLQVNQAQALASYLDARVREGWESFQFPELCPVEERFFRADRDAAVTYAAGDEVYDAASGSYYRSLQDANLNHDVSEGAWWENADADLDRYVAYEQAGQTVIGEALEVYLSNPDANWRAPTLTFRLSDKGVQCLTNAASVWLEFRLRPSRFTAELYAAGTAYAAGDLIYDAATGDCYQAGAIPPVLVAGSGDESLNVVFTPTGQIINGKPAYFNSAGDGVIYWGDATWKIAANQVGAPRYSSGDDVDYPWQVATWTALSAAPAPTSVAKTFPAPPSTFWTRVPFPYVLADFVKRAAYADALREDGQLDKATIEESRATKRLEDEMEKVVSQQHQSAGFRLNG